MTVFKDKTPMYVRIRYVAKFQGTRYVLFNNYEPPENMQYLACIKNSPQGGIKQSHKIY